MALDNFIPTVWAAQVMRTLEKTHVFGAVANRDYEGEISGYGDSVKINQIGAVAVATYTKNSTSISPETLHDAQSILNINQSKYFAFQIDDVDKAQQNPKIMTSAMAEASYALKDTQDTYVAGLYAQAGVLHATYTNASPLDMTSVNVEEGFLEIAELMDENSVQREGRFAIIPPWVHTKLIIAGLSTLTENVDLWKNSFVGNALGFNFHMSNNVSKNSTSWDKTRVICGVAEKSISLAEQIVSVEAYRPESKFADAVKGLHVYGAKIVRPDMTSVLYCDKTAEP